MQTPHRVWRISSGPSSARLALSDIHACMVSKQAGVLRQQSMQCCQHYESSPDHLTHCPHLTIPHATMRAWFLEISSTFSRTDPPTFSLHTQPHTLTQLVSRSRRNCTCARTASCTTMNMQYNTEQVPQTRRRPAYMQRAATQPLRASRLNPKQALTSRCRCRQVQPRPEPHACCTSCS